MLKFSLALILLLACLTLGPASAASNWNQDARNYVLQIHNDKRRAEGGCHIDRLDYDTNLESQAKTWVEKCNFQHEGKQGRGENLAWNTATSSEHDLVKSATDMWFNEKPSYTYGQHSCMDTNACHYTQMVWGSTNRVGCYSNRCSNLQNGAANAWFIACFYTPPGNWVGQQPYPKNCPSLCQQGQTAQNGLCVGQVVVG